MSSTRAQDLDAALFERAVAEHGGRLLNIARSIVGRRACGEDVVQQALTNLYEHRARYDWNDAGPLMRRAVVNEALRAASRRAPASLDDEYPVQSRAPIHRLIDHETRQQIHSAIERLPGHYRAALVLCEYEDLAYAQIADVLDASIPQVKTWLFRARRQLAVLLEEMFEPAGSFRASGFGSRLSSRLQ